MRFWDIMRFWDNALLRQCPRSTLSQKRIVVEAHVAKAACRRISTLHTTDRVRRLVSSGGRVAHRPEPEAARRWALSPSWRTTQGRKEWSLLRRHCANTYTSYSYVTSLPTVSSTSVSAFTLTLYLSTSISTCSVMNRPARSELSSTTLPMSSDPVSPVLMQACRRLQKLVIGLKSTPYENLNIFKSA